MDEERVNRGGREGMRPLEAAIVLPQKWCISPARSHGNERLVALSPLPMTRSMKRFAEDLRLRDI
jgi:hypothetical protein